MFGGTELYLCGDRCWIRYFSRVYLFMGKCLLVSVLCYYFCNFFFLTGLVSFGSRFCRLLGPGWALSGISCEAEID